MDFPLNRLDHWIDSAGDNQTKDIRRIFRIVLLAIASSEELQSIMRLKGGVLLDLQFGTGRSTKDVDFSTSEKFDQFNFHEFLDQFDRALKRTSTQRSDDFLCLVQSHQVKPPGEGKTFQTAEIKVGYARRDSNEYKRLLRKRSPHTLPVDFSFNEVELAVDTLTVDGVGFIRAYSLEEQIAEKLRAILQLPNDRRNRFRWQDVYDIASVLNQGYLHSDNEKANVLSFLAIKAESRRIHATKDMIDESEIEARARKRYNEVYDNVSSGAPSFEDAFSTVKDFYHSLPW